MQRFITDERTGIRYELIGDYYYPCLTAEENLFSRYGKNARAIFEHKRVLYYNFLMTSESYKGTPAEIDTSACDMAEYLIKEMVKGVTEQLKGCGYDDG